MLQQFLLETALSEWIAAAAISVTLFIATNLTIRLFVKRIPRLLSKTNFQIEGISLKLLNQTKSWFLLSVSIFAGLSSLNLPESLSRKLNITFTILVLIQIWLWSREILHYFIFRFFIKSDRDSGHHNSAPALEFIGRFLILSLLILVGLDNLGINVTALIASLGIGGIAIALAVQNILGDLLASLSIVLDKPFKVGDFIVVDSYMGTVEKIGLKTTRVRSLSGELLIFGNTDLLKSRIQNFKQMEERRVVFKFGVTYQTSPQQLESIPGILREIIGSTQGTRFDRAHFTVLGESSYDFEVVYFVLDANYNIYMDIQQHINLELVRRFASQKIEFAFPTRTIYMGTNT